MKEFALDQTHAHDLATESKQEPDAREVRRKVFRKANAGSASGQHVEPLEGGTGFSAAINAGLVVMRSGGGEVDQTATTLVARAAEGSGHGLPGELRGRFEQSLGTDLGGVRVHSDSAAGEASSALGARAYAVGQDVYM